MSRFGVEEVVREFFRSTERNEDSSGSTRVSLSFFKRILAKNCRRFAFENLTQLLLRLVVVR